jgi:hypothetical protein
MGVSTGSGSRREYTVFGTSKMVKNGKMDPKKSSFWAKSAKNDPNPEKSAS